MLRVGVFGFVVPICKPLSVCVFVTLQLCIYGISFYISLYIFVLVAYHIFRVIKRYTFLSYVRQCSGR